MIKLYGNADCLSCRKAKRWLREKDLVFLEREVEKDPFTKDELREIVSATEEGLMEIIATNSNVYKELRGEIESLALDECVSILAEYPQLIKKPLIIDKKHLVIGFKEEELAVFIPQEVRKFISKDVYLKQWPLYTD
jgi:regulatory protein spx